MRYRWEASVPLAVRLLLVFLFGSLLGLSPRPHLASEAMQQAEQSAAGGHMLAAANHVARSAELLPFPGGLWELAGRYALQGGDIPRAGAYLERAARTGTLSKRGWLDLGDALRQAGDLEGAIQAWQNALKQDNADPALVQRLQQAHLDLGDYPAAVADLQALASLKPQDAQVLYRLGLVLATQQPEAGAQALGRAAALDPGYAVAARAVSSSLISTHLAEDPSYMFLNLGRALAGLQEWALAAEAFHQALQLRPDYAEAWAYMGEAVQHQPLKAGPPGASPHRQDGYPYLEQALKLDPSSLSANTFLGLYWQRQGRYDLALQSLDQAARLDPGNPVLQVQIGEIQALSGDLEAALATYQKAVSLAPNDARYQRFLASFSLKYELRIDQVALPAARQAVTLEPSNPASLDLMAQVLLKLDDRLNALRFLNRALQVDPKYAPAHLHLGLYYLVQADSQSAHRELLLARSLPGDGATAEQADRLLENNFP